MQYFIPFVIIGAAFGIGIYALISWLGRRNIAFKWYEWAIGILAIILLLLGIQHLFGALTEFYAYAAWIGFAIFTIPAIIMLIILWQLVAKRVNIKAK